MLGAHFRDIPRWLEEIIQQMALRSRDLSRQPFQGFRENIVPELTPDMRRASEMARAHVGAHVAPLADVERRMIAAGTPITEQDIAAHQNPYIAQVVDRLGREGERTFREWIAPQIEAKFTRLGQHGSRHHRRQMERYSRDIMAEIADRQHQALAKSFHEAQGMARSERERASETARHLAALTGLRSANTQADIESLMTHGQTERQREQDLANVRYREYLRQQAFPMEQLAQQSAMLQGIPYSVAQTVYPQTMFQAHQQAGHQSHLNTLGQIGNIASQFLAARHAGAFR